MKVVPARGLAPTLLCLAASCAAHPKSSSLTFEHLGAGAKDPPATIDLLFDPQTPSPRPVILLLGALKADAPPDWSSGLLSSGFALAAFTVAHPPDPDPARRPQWLVFDERFAHSYVLGASRATTDASRVIDLLATRKDIDTSRIGWLGISSTGIPALAAATLEKRIRAVLVFVSTGALAEWFRTWRENGLWVGKSADIWPETRRLLETEDPIRRAAGLWPAAVLMVSGGDDRVVDPRSARAFLEAARPAYSTDPDRLQLIVLDGLGHNLPAEIVRGHVESWFRRHLSSK